MRGGIVVLLRAGRLALRWGRGGLGDRRRAPMVVARQILAAHPPFECPCVTLMTFGAALRGGRSRPALRRLDSSSGMPTAVLPALHWSMPTRVLTCCGSCDCC